MIQLELLNEQNEAYLLQIHREGIPKHFVEEVSDTIVLAKWGDEHGLKGHCFGIRYGEKYVGIILIGEAIPEDVDPDEVKGKEYFRILGFVIDSRYQNMGIGSVALKQAIKAIFEEYGKVILLLECHKDNRKAMYFYEKNGFTNTGVLNEKDSDYYLIMK